MKMWWVHSKGVEAVEADFVIEDMVTVLTATAGKWIARASDVFDTEAEARREHVDRQVCALEELADKHDKQRADAEELAKGHMDDAEWNRVKAAEARARAKGLRDALEAVAAPVKWVSMDEAREMYPEVKDATEGRR